MQLLIWIRGGYRGRGRKSASLSRCRYGEEKCVGGVATKMHENGIRFDSSTVLTIGKLGAEEDLRFQASSVQTMNGPADFGV